MGECDRCEICGKNKIKKWTEYWNIILYIWSWWWVPVWWPWKWFGAYVFSKRLSQTWTNSLRWQWAMVIFWIDQKQRRPEAAYSVPIEYYRGPSGRNLYWVIAHEIGHALGLPHTSNDTGLMVPYYNGYVEKRPHLTENDIRAAQSLYGKPSAVISKKSTKGKSILSLQCLL